MIRKIFDFFNQFIDEYGITAFSGMLVLGSLFLLTLFTLVLAHWADEPRAFSALGWIAGGELFKWAFSFLSQIHRFLWWTIPMVAGGAGLFLVFRRLTSSREDPLFAPRIALLALVVLARLAWNAPMVRGVVEQMASDETGICQTILAIMLLGLGGVMLQLLGLQREHRQLIFLEDRLTASTRTAEQLLDETEKTLIGARGVLGEKYRNLKDAMDHAARADYETLVSFPNQRELLKESKISFVIKVLPILGMIGTVLGFTLAVLGMQSAATNMHDFASFKGNMLDALGGMKNAFLTTLAGMAGMVAVMWANSVMEEARRRVLLLEDELLYIRFFLPRRRRSRESND